MKKKILFWFLSLLFGGSLTVLVLFNLPVFYESSQVESIKLFSIALVLFVLAVSVSIKFLAIPLGDFHYKNRKNVILITLLFLVFVSVYAFTSKYYWVVPQIHRLDVCYRSDDPLGELKLYELHDFKTGQLYPSEALGYQQYPIKISSDTCISGEIQALVEKNGTWQGLVVMFGKKDENETALIGINRETAYLSLSAGADAADRVPIVLNAGVTSGKIVAQPWGSILFLWAKGLSLILGSVYSALLVFTLSEMIIFHHSRRIVSHKIALAIVIVYFIIFGFLMANHGGQPDQRKHVYFSSRYSETWGFPKEDPQSPYFVQDNVFFYYWVNGAVVKLAHLLSMGSVSMSINPQNDHLVLTDHDLLMLRLLSVAISAGTLFYIYKLTAAASRNKLGGVLAAFFTANTLMFVFLSGGISFDNFLSLCSAAAIYHLICILKRDDYIKNTAWLGIWSCLGAITKNEGALLAFILFLIWLIYSLAQGRGLKFQFSHSNIILILILVFTSGLFLRLYAGNLIKYGRPLPKCHQIKPEEYCTNFSYRKSERQDLNLSQLWSERNTIVGPFEYASNYWIFNLINGIWGIISHNTYVPKFITSLHAYLIMIAILCMVRYWSMEDTAASVLLVIVLSFIGYLFSFNYFNELEMGFRHYAVQGRYAFPVLGAFFALMVHYFLQIRPLSLRRMTLSLAMIVYFAGGLGVFVFKYSEVFVSWRIFF